MSLDLSLLPDGGVSWLDASGEGSAPAIPTRLSSWDPCWRCVWCDVRWPPKIRERSSASTVHPAYISSDM